MPNRLPGGAIAQGSIFSLFGANLGPSQPVQVSLFPLAASLGNVSIAVTQGSTTVNAIPLYVSASQINAIMPSNTPLGAVSVRVTYNNSKSNPMAVIVAQTAPGVFTANGTGFGPGILQNFVSSSAQPINSPAIAAQPGQAITLWGTGLGPVVADNVAPTINTPGTKVEVFVGGVAASILYSGRTPCCAGTDQIVFTVPANAPLGCWVPVTLRTAGTTVSNVVTMAITADGTSCFNASPAPPFTVGGAYGVFGAIRAATHEDIGTISPIDVTADYQVSLAAQVPDSPFPYHPVFSLPPAGTCSSISVAGDLLRADLLAGYLPAGNTGALASSFGMTTPRGSKTLNGVFMPNPLNYLGAALTGNLIPNSLFLDPGSYQISGAGGSIAGAFSASLNVPTPFTWTNRDQIVLVDRTQPLQLSWSGAAPGLMLVIGFGVDLPTNTTTVFGCVAPPGASSFTIPPLVLANVPASRANPLQSKSVIYLDNYPGSATVGLTASGLDSGLATVAQASGKTVIFQ